MYYNKPVSTHDTMAQVRGVSRCGKNQNCTHTHDTCFKNTAGLPIPVLNPIHMVQNYWQNLILYRRDKPILEFDYLLRRKSEYVLLFYLS